MRGLTVVLIEASADRLAGALALACTQAALGGRVRLHLHDRAAALLGRPAHRDLLDDALALGVEVTACQGGLADAGLDLGAIDPRLGGSGLVAVLASLDEDRLVTL